jgi:uncharacterized protein (DUF2062 family)
LQASWLRRIWERLVRMDGTPEGIAGGVALGVAIGVAPTFGLGLIIAAGVAALFRLNMAAAIIGSMAGSPPIIPFIWLASAWIGALMLGMDWQALYEQARAGGLFKAGRDVFLAYLAGNVVLTVVFTIAAYFAVLLPLRRYRRAPAVPPSRRPR